MFDIGLMTEFDDAISILDPIIIANAQAVKLPTNVGRFWEMMGAPSRAFTQKRYEIRTRSLTALSGVIGDGAGTGWADGSTTTNLPMTAAGVNALVVGTVLKVESEMVVVKDVNRTANTIDVFARGAGQTTGAAHVDTTVYSVVGSAGNDTDLKNVETRAESTSKYLNYSQTIFETVDYTFSDNLLGREGLDPENIIAVNRQEAMNRVSRMLASMTLLGTKQVGSKTIPYMSAGLYEQLSDNEAGARLTNTYNVSGTFDEAKLKIALEQVFRTGNPGVILCSQTNKKIINEFNQSFIQTPRPDKTAGYSVDKYDYEGAILDVVVDADCTDDKVAVVSADMCRKGWLAGDILRYADEPQTSSRENRGSLQGSVGFEIEGVGYDHTLLYGIT